MIIIRNVKMPLDTDFERLSAVVSKKFNINALSVRLYKRRSMQGAGITFSLIVLFWSKRPMIQRF